jgi:hypothetical protein
MIAIKYSAKLTLSGRLDCNMVFIRAFIDFHKNETLDPIMDGIV